MTFNLLGRIRIKRTPRRRRCLSYFKRRSSTPPASRFEKRQAADRILRRSIPLLDANEQILRRWLADLDADPAATAKVAAGETHKCPGGRVLRIKIDISMKWRRPDTPERDSALDHSLRKPFTSHETI